MKKRVILFVVVLLAIVSLALKLTLFSDRFVYTGVVETVKVEVPSRISSVISECLVDQGARVKAGDLLLSLSCEDLSLEAKLTQANFERSEKLFNAGSLPKEAFDLSQNKKDLSALMLSWCRVKSPITGTVLTKYHEPGEMVAPGTKLFTLANLQDVYVYIYVPQPQVSKLSLGQKLLGKVPELPQREFEGSISEIASEAEFTPKNVQTRQERERLVYAVKVAFKNTDEILKPGMFVEVLPPQ